MFKCDKFLQRHYMKGVAPAPANAVCKKVMATRL